MNTKKQVLPVVENVKTLPTIKNEELANSVQKTTISAMIEKFKPTPPTADERIQRIQFFEALSNRYKVLKEKANDLKMFDAGNDKTNAKIIFKNSQGFEFEIRNSTVIEKLKTEAEKELNILLKDSENEILNFEI